MCERHQMLEYAEVWPRMFLLHVNECMKFDPWGGVVLGAVSTLSRSLAMVLGWQDKLSFRLQGYSSFGFLIS